MTRRQFLHPIRRLAVAVALAAIACSGISDAHATAAASGPVSARVPILMYHQIATPAQEPLSRPDLVVPPDEFALQMSGLQRAGWRSETLAALAREMRAGAQTPARTFVVTIDDGGLDGYTNAAPILSEHGFAATYFVISGRIDEPDYMTRQQLRLLIAAGSEVSDHSRSHQRLTGRSKGSLKREICDAADEIGRLAGVRPVTFAYPFGDFDDAAIAAVRSCAGILLAVTTDRRGAVGATDRFHLSRLAVLPGTTPADLIVAMESAS
jgi:peptidoglycan/xylan/chitin deacetylase (PgdA/CDA1 family)